MTAGHIASAPIEEKSVDPGKRIAVVLFNLGGPDKPESVRPFLFNLFNDRAIIGLPNPFRWLLAQLISRRRAPIAREIYQHLGGGSPLLPNTEQQATALDDVLNMKTADSAQVKTFIAMRYWHPRAQETARQVAAYDPTDIILLSLYPQFSTTTVASSLKEWRAVARKSGLRARTRSICCYPTEPGFIEAMADNIRSAKAQMGKGARFLFTAHGVPKKIIARGDPYQWQVEQTAAALAGAAGLKTDEWCVCYQSRVGPLEWIGPSTEDEITRAGENKTPIALVPIAFVSEHSETLVELDIEYRDLAEQAGVPAYHRIPTVGIQKPFIDGLARLVLDATQPGDIAAKDDMADKIAPDRFAASGGRLCPKSHIKCPCAVNRI